MSILNIEKVTQTNKQQKCHNSKKFQKLKKELYAVGEIRFKQLGKCNLGLSMVVGDMMIMSSFTKEVLTLLLNNGATMEKVTSSSQWIMIMCVLSTVAELDELTGTLR